MDLKHSKFLEVFDCPSCGKQTPKPYAEQKTINRFLSYVKKTDSCWIWVGSKMPPEYTYGAFKLKQKMIRAHRASWEIFRSPIPDGLIIRHKCDNPPCVNPDHLVPGTKKENIHDMISRGRANWRGLKGEEHHNSKLKNNDVIRIRGLHSNGMAIRKISKMYNMTFENISMIVRRISWTHI